MTNERNSYVLSMKKYSTSIHESPEKNTFKHVQTGKNSLRCGGLSTSAIKRLEKHEEERCVKCLPLSPVCCWLQLAASERNRQKKTMQRCHDDHRVLSLCVIFFTNSYHPFPQCRGWRRWWRRRGELTHINSINSGRETRSNDMKKWNLQTTDTRQSARSVPGVTVWKLHRLLYVANACDGNLH